MGKGVWPGDRSPGREAGHFTMPHGGGVGGRRHGWLGPVATADPPILASFPVPKARTDAGMNEQAVTLGRKGRQDWAPWK